MTNEKAFAEFQYAVNHWFKFMDDQTRHRAVQIAALAINMVDRETEAKQVSVVQHALVAAQQAQIAWSEYSDQLSPSNPIHVTGRGKVFIGKTWMLNRSTGERARVAQDQVQAYLAKGFVKAGPRSAA